ncbi:MAG: uL13 family ribosomal protein, partial [Verrucomicrobiota bacterium]
MKTFLPKVDVQRRKWRVIDAEGAVLGRLAVQVADALRGKDKPIFTP